MTALKEGAKVLVSRSISQSADPIWVAATVVTLNSETLTLKLDAGRFFTPSGLQSFSRILEGVDWKRMS